MTSRWGILTLMLAATAAAQEHVSFPTEDGWVIHGDLYGTGDRGNKREVFLVFALMDQSWP